MPSAIVESAVDGSNVHAAVHIALGINSRKQFTEVYNHLILTTDCVNQSINCVTDLMGLCYTENC